MAHRARDRSRSSGGFQRRENQENSLQRSRRDQIRQGRAGNQEKFTTKRLMLKMIVSNLLPLAITEDTNFQAFVKALKPTANIPNKSVMRSELLTVYEDKKMAVRLSLASADDVVLTCELRLSRAEYSYLTVGCHFVDKNGKLKSYMLETTCLFGDQSADNIKNQLSAIMEAWGIKEKVHTVVTAGIPKLKEIKAKWTHVPCFAYTLNMVFKDLLMCDDSLREVLTKCQEIVRFFKNDSEAEQKLREIQNQQKLQQEELIMYTGEGWLTLLHMLERLQQQYKAMPMVLNERGKTHFILNENDKKKMHNTISALVPLREATSMMKEEGFDTISVVIPLLKKLMENLTEQAKTRNNVAARLLSKCKDQFGDVSNNKMAPITALDPRFKNQLGDQNKRQAKDKIIKELSESTAGSASSAPDLECLLSSYMAYTPTAESANPLAWWRFTGLERFGEMSKLALKKLGTVSTAVPLDRAFSNVDDRFCSLSSSQEPENINMILFLNSNWDTKP
ncbi:zinc finger BED domain-containing protein 4-like [Centroberyx affinis]|uniref:zinc finger BED domain-containing protein 4-like n=1 Tax=Centroberyx affinis TaxID=166261 RepID=UPI003A5C176A